MDGRPNRRNKAVFSLKFLQRSVNGAFVDVTKQSAFSSVIIINSVLITITRPRVAPTVGELKTLFLYFSIFFFFSLKAN